MNHNASVHQRKQPEKKEEKTVFKKENPLDLWGSAAPDNSKLSRHAKER